ncbi:hypothetical protein [Vibrio gazogenes]|uniref:Uncharacterized protein n=1 Tax=Vibrio gazogenes DSM 21264 = NBRC 103151 TaxID=1123492 RepID=A0A1M4ZDT6_VIBGA|nr:hypothetical protein [Vibrio gazogenes]USP12446.1 hypothetical protein MKS89_08180 [Vibrio gazogenes]SHF15942.1 hypothetical protein SAMN02745781_01567 [Vibrio gazogenes DSM 21264] [Vibrio gazogenes DSM 21264 = NBRC 103151]SJN53839.1 hypothetical protein BQ6471_00666 [Vibrio gazogenes]
MISFKSLSRELKSDSLAQYYQRRLEQTSQALEQEAIQNMLSLLSLNNSDGEEKNDKDEK